MLVNGIEDIGIGVTITDSDDPRPLPMLRIDEPTLTMNFCVNTSPLAGREGKYVTSRQMRDRLDRELRSNVALRVRDTADDGVFEVSGRGELHLTILLENMRREGYELAVSRPRVVFQERRRRAARADRAGERRRRGAAPGRGDAGTGRAQGRSGRTWSPTARGRVRLDYRIPARGLIGFSNEFLNLTRGTGLDRATSSTATSPTRARSADARTAC